MSIAKFRVGRSAASGAHSEYITRVSAATRIDFHNLDFLAAEDLSQARTDAISYIYARQDIELARSLGSATGRKFGKDQAAADDIVPEHSVRGNNNKSNGKKPFGGQSKSCQKGKNIRTHYRLLLCWDRKVEADEAIVEAHRYLEKKLPQARAVIAVHDDTNHTHTHIWIDARQIDGKKIHLAPKEFRTFDEDWALQYDERYGTTYAAEHQQKKLETKQWKYAAVQARQVLREELIEIKEEVIESENKGSINDNLKADSNSHFLSGEKDELPKNVILPPKPLRSADTFDHHYWREKEIAALGGHLAPSGKRDNHQSETNQTSIIRTGESDHEETRSRTNSSIAQRRNRLAQNAKQSPLGRKSDVLLSTRSEGGETGSGQGGTGVSLVSDQRDVFIGGASQTDSSEPAAIESQFGENPSQHLPQSAIYDVDDRNTRNLADESALQENSREDVYQRQLRVDQTNQETGWRAATEIFGSVKHFETNSIELFELPATTVTTPQFAANNEAFVKEVMAMMKTSLEASNRELSQRAAQIYQTQLKEQCSQSPTREQAEQINQLNERNPPEEQVSLADKSSLEANYAILNSMKGDKREIAFSEQAEQLEQKADSEKQLELQKQQALDVSLEL